MVIVLMASLMVGAADAAEPAIYHEPVLEQTAGVPLVLRINGGDLAALGQLELHYRRTGRSEWRSLGFERLEDGGFITRIPGDDILPPGLEYFIAVRSGDRLQPRFASAQTPHPVTVNGDSVESRMEVELERFDGHRSRASVLGSFDNFGAQGNLPDYMWAGGADFTYRMLTTLRSLRFGVSRMRAEGIVRGEAEEAGYDHGFAEIEVSPHDLLGLRGQVQLGANQDQFTAGGLGTLRIGLDPGTHVDVFFGGAGGVGLRSGVTLHWATVPRVPMHGGVEITNWPTEDVWAIRLRYGVDIPLGDQLELLGRVNYQARTAVYGGIGGGMGMAWSF